MAERFIDELMRGPNPLGITVEEPKAYDDTVLANDILNLPPEMEEVLKMIVLGVLDPRKKIKTARQLLLAMKGKIKGGRLKTQQPFKFGQIGAPKAPPVNVPVGPWSTPRTNIPKFDIPKPAIPGTPHRVPPSPGGGGDAEAAIASFLATLFGAKKGMERGTPDWMYKILERVMPDPDMNDMSGSSYNDSLRGMGKAIR